MPIAQICDFIVSFEIIMCTRIRLHNRGVDTALVLAAKHLFFRAVKPKNTTLTEMRVRIDYFRFSHKPVFSLFD
jgi:hypothetical protein